MIKIRTLLSIAAVSLAAASASAATYNISTSLSTLGDVGKIGGQNIPEISLYSTCIAPSTCSGVLDPTNPAHWPLMDKDITTLPDYTDINNPTGIEANTINVGGVVTVVSGSVTAATINQLNPLRFGTFQTVATTSNLVAGDPSVINCDHTSGAQLNAKCVPSVPMTWTYNLATNQLNHQSGGGTGLTSASIATCEIIVGGGFTGSCNQFQAATDASGQYGQMTIGNSIWNWNGMAANYIVRDSSTTPWHTATGTSTTGGLQISGASGLPGVVWDLSGFVDGVGGIITARVVADALTGNSATGITGLYTLHLSAVVPVPAAVWMLGGALGVLGAMRRRQRTA